MNSVNCRSKAPPPSRSLCISLFAATSIDPRLTEGSFRNDDDNDDVSKNVAIKETAFFFRLCCGFSNSSNMSFFGEFPWNWILRDQQKKKREKKREREIRRPKFASSIKRGIKGISPRTRAVKATKCIDKARRTCRVAVLLINLLPFCLSRRCRCRRCYGSIESGLERGGRGRKQANLVLARCFLSAFLDREQKFIKASFGWSICTHLFGDQRALRSIKTNVRLVSTYQNLFLSLKIQGWVNMTF